MEPLRRAQICFWIVRRRSDSLRKFILSFHDADFEWRHFSSGDRFAPRATLRSENPGGVGLLIVSSPPRERPNPVGVTYSRAMDPGHAWTLSLGQVATCRHGLLTCPNPRGRLKRYEVEPDEQYVFKPLD